MKKRKKCKYCGEDVVAPHNYDYHFGCDAAALAKEILKIDVEEIKLKEK